MVEQPNMASIRWGLLQDIDMGIISKEEAKKIEAEFLQSLAVGTVAVADLEVKGEKCKE